MPDGGIFCIETESLSGLVFIFVPQKVLCVKIYIVSFEMLLPFCANQKELVRYYFQDVIQLMFGNFAIVICKNTSTC